MRRNIDLEELKKIEIELLKYFSEYCDKNQLQYYLTYGTLIGAIRHKGFIPWDDDIDVIMPRSDYERLIESFNNNQKDSNYSIVSHKLDDNYYLPFAKLVDNRTILKENANVDLDIGVFIDIFPLDNLSDDYKKAYRIIKKGYVLNAKWVIKIMTFEKKRSLFKNVAIRLGKLLLKRKSIHDLVSNIDEFASKRQEQSFSNYVGVICGISRGKPDRIFKKEWFEETVLVDFEGGLYHAPIGYDSLLKQQYGNYMELPPVDKRVTHHSFDAWYKE